MPDEEAIAQNEIEAAVEYAVASERARCIEILNRARAGEIDGDFRSLISRIKNPRVD